MLVAYSQGLVCIPLYNVRTSICYLCMYHLLYCKMTCEKCWNSYSGYFEYAIG